jgi:drug/metabolite transporter (DMT)-like permease
VTSSEKNPWLLYVLPQGLLLYVSDLQEVGIHSFGEIPVYISVFMFLFAGICFAIVNETTEEEIKNYQIPVWIGWFLYLIYAAFYTSVLLIYKEQLTNLDQVFALLALLFVQTTFWLLHIVKMRRKLGNQKS